MRREAGKTLILAAALAAVVTPTTALAQPMAGMGAGGGMPDLRAISGRPLPDRGMPTGTVSVRVARKTPQNGVADAEVVAVVKNAGGDLRKRTAKTDGSGRAMFEGLAPGDRFKAEITVDRERLATEEFTMPSEGGVRTMLIAGLGAAPAGAGAGAGQAGRAGAQADDDEDFGLGASTGVAEPDTSLPTGSLVVRLIDEAGKPIANHPIMLGAIDATNKIKVRRATSDATGTARFADLPTGQGVGYAAVIEHKGARLGSEPFGMPDSGGVRVEIKALAHTRDPSVITVGSGGRLILQMREDALQFLEMLPLENTSDKLFDPGVAAIEIPLPQGFVSAEAGETGRKIEIRQNHGAAVHGTITPKKMLNGIDARSASNEVTIGFVLPYKGDSKEFEQLLPNGIGTFTLITEQVPGLTITGRGVGARESRELGGRKYWVAPVEAIPPGGTLQLTISGLPSNDTMGRWVSAALALALVFGAIVFGRRPRSEAKVAADRERERLTSQRETLFTELVAVERAGQGNREGRRGALMIELEGVYRRLAALDEQRAL